MPGRQGSTNSCWEQPEYPTIQHTEIVNEVADSPAADVFYKVTERRFRPQRKLTARTALSATGSLNMK